MIMVLCR